MRGHPRMSPSRVLTTLTGALVVGMMPETPVCLSDTSAGMSAGNPGITRISVMPECQILKV